MDNPIDILEMDVGGIKVKDMTALSFYQYLARKISGLPAFKADVVELSALVASPPMTRSMPADEKIRLVKKLQSLGVSLP